ncbi:hypothetical protein MCEMSEM23_02717 [Rhabdaerophilaceae bacterium]
MKRSASRPLVAFAALLAFWTIAVGQTPDPFTRPPPTQAPPTAPAPQGNTLTMEVLGRQGFEVKAVSRVSDRSPGFVVLMQRAGDIRTCLLRIERAQNQAPRQSSLCF